MDVFSLECTHLYVQLLSILMQNALERTIHIAKELRFPHFFEGCMLRKYVCTRESVCLCTCGCVCTRVNVGNFPLELK